MIGPTREQTHELTTGIVGTHGQRLRLIGTCTCLAWSVTGLVAAAEHLVEQLHDQVQARFAEHAADPIIPADPLWRLVNAQ